MDTLRPCGGGHDAEEPTAVFAGVPAADGRPWCVGGGRPDSLSREFEPTAQSIWNWVRQAERDEGTRTDGLTTEEKEELRRSPPRGPCASRGEGDPEKSRGLVRSGDRIDAPRAFEFVRIGQKPPGATCPMKWGTPSSPSFSARTFLAFPPDQPRASGPVRPGVRPDVTTCAASKRSTR